jgi:hypothetical protein
MPSITVAAFVFGLAFVLAALSGKDIEVVAIKIPALEKRSRIILGVAGLILIFVGATDPFTRPDPPPSPPASAEANVAPTEETALSPSQPEATPVTQVSPTPAPSQPEAAPVTEVSPPPATTQPEAAPAEEVAIASDPVDLLAAQKWTVKYSDDFKDESSAQHWALLAEPTGQVKNSFKKTFKIEVKPNGEAQTDTYAFYTNGLATIAPDFLLTAAMKYKEQKGCQYGLIFRANLNNEYYWFYLAKSEKNAHYGVKRHAENQWAEVIPLTPLPDNLQPDSLAVLGTTNNYQLYLDDQLVNQFEDNSIAGNGVGLGTMTCPQLKSGSYTVDNFQVSEP